MILKNHGMCGISTGDRRPDNRVRISRFNEDFFGEIGIVADQSAFNPLAMANNLTEISTISL